LACRKPSSRLPSTFGPVARQLGSYLFQESCPTRHEVPKMLFLPGFSTPSFPAPGPWARSPIAKFLSFPPEASGQMARTHFGFFLQLGRTPIRCFFFPFRTGRGFCPFFATFRFNKTFGFPLFAIRETERFFSMPLSRTLLLFPTKTLEAPPLQRF